MYSIAMVGVNTYHAEAYTRIFNGGGGDEPRITNARITHVWAGDHPDRLAELEQMLGPYDHKTESLDDLIGVVDGVLVIDDTGLGARHAELAKPFIAAGMPVFVDKPMTIDFEDTIQLFDLAEKHNAPIFSSSALRFPVELDPDAIAVLGNISSIVSVGTGEWFNYGVHAVEVMGTVTADTPASVHRHALPEKDVAVVTYESGLVGVVMTLRDAQYIFEVTVYGEHGAYSSRIDDGMGFYTNQMKEFVEMIETRTPPVTRAETLNVLSILHAGNRSAGEGRAVNISEITGGQHG